MKFFRYLQKIENKFHSFWINRCLDPWDDLLKKYWNWVGSMPALSKTNKNIFDYFLAFLNILLFIITCLCLPLYWFLGVFLPFVIWIQILALTGMPWGIAFVLGIPLGLCFARRYVLNDWGRVYI